MDNFLISIDFDPATGAYAASYFNGQVIELNAGSYHDAVLEADAIDLEEQQ